MDGKVGRAFRCLVIRLNKNKQTVKIMLVVGIGHVQNLGKKEVGRKKNHVRLCFFLSPLGHSKKKHYFCTQIKPYPNAAIIQHNEGLQGAKFAPHGIWRVLM